MEAKTIYFDCLWQSSTKRIQIANFLKTSLVKQSTKQFIINHIRSVTDLLHNSTNKDETVVDWLWINSNDSIFVARGSKSLASDSLLIHSFLKCLIREGTHIPQYIFSIKSSRELIELSDNEIMDMLIFLGYVDIFIVLNEFHETGGRLACIIKEMQDFGTDSTHPFGMLLFGSNQLKVQDVTRSVFYCIKNVCIFRDPIPDTWLQYGNEKPTTITTQTKIISDDIRNIRKIITLRKELCAQITVMTQTIKERFGKSIALWDHLMHTHQGAMNPNGIFRNDTCEVKIGLNTNYGMFFDAETKCGAEKNAKKCETCMIVDEENELFDLNTTCHNLLGTIAAAGFRWYGFYPNLMQKEENIRVYDETLCDCFKC
jgi:hypothetical protein